MVSLILRAWATDFTVNGVAYTITDTINHTVAIGTGSDNAAISTSTSGTFSIQSSVNYNSVTYKVTSVGDWAFWSCWKLTSITIPSSVTSIGYVAFQGCSDLTSITIPSSVTSIGSSAFVSCYNLTYIAIPSFVTSIGDYTFYACRGLTSMIIPSSVTSIGESAFEGCTGLSSITLPNSLTSIGDQAFYRSGLTTVTIPSSVTSIGIDTFDFCVNLISFTVDKNNPSFSSIEGILFNKDQTKIIKYPEGIEAESYAIPLTVSSIGFAAFYNAKITYITIPARVSLVDKYAFAYCTKLTSIIVDSNNINYSSKNGVLFNKGQTRLIQYPKGNTNTSYTIPSTVNRFGDGAFWYCNYLTSISIPTSVQQINDCVFIGCKGLTSISIPSSVTYIGDCAFQQCLSLTSIKIPSSVTYIGADAFLACKTLNAISIPSSVKRIKFLAFAYCEELSDIYVQGTTPIDLSYSDSYSVFGGVNKTTCTLHVPYGTASLYRTAFQWKDFINIVEEDEFNVNHMPVANAGTDQSVNETMSVTLNGSKSYDLDSDTITFKWTAPIGITMSSTTVAKPTFNAPEVKKDSTVTFSLIVNDGTKDSQLDQVVITVQNVNKMPAANAGIDQSINEGSIVYLDGTSSSDPDGNPITYKWTAPSGITLSSATSAKPSFIAPEVKKDSTVTFSLIVNDGVVNSTPAKVNITILNVINVGVSNLQVPYFKIYPNPVSNELIIEMEGNNKVLNFEVLNAVGQMVFKGNLVDKTTVQTSNFTSGIYIIKLENGKTFEFKKIIKK